MDARFVAFLVFVAFGLTGCNAANNPKTLVETVGAGVVAPASVRCAAPVASGVLSGVRFTSDPAAALPEELPEMVRRVALQSGCFRLMTPADYLLEVSGHVKVVPVTGSRAGDAAIGLIPFVGLLAAATTEQVREAEVRIVATRVREGVQTVVSTVGSSKTPPVSGTSIWDGSLEGVALTNGLETAFKKLATQLQSAPTT